LAAYRQLMRNAVQAASDSGVVIAQPRFATAMAA
jgi:hypothetical protein